jgi:creatinine amidohydrolase
MSDVLRWGELTREGIGAAASGALLVVPVGTTEQHGPHLATCTDALVVGEVASRAAIAAGRPDTVLLAPTLAYGASDHHLPFGGTLSLRDETFAAVLDDLLASASAAGSRCVFVLNGHGGNRALCAAAVARAALRHGITAATALVSELVAPDAVGGSPLGHAGWFETSLVLALRPELVDTDAARPSPGGPARTRPRGLVVAEAGRWEALDGFTDRPDEASAGQGERALEACVAAAARAFEELADACRP